MKQEKAIAWNGVVEAEEGDHSTYTTLLLDDSPIKVLLQPCNHICIREYGAALTGLDLTLPVIAKRRRPPRMQARGGGKASKKEAE